MVTFNLSYTEPINPAGVEPVLTQSQIWQCIDRKVRHAEQFVAAIASTEVLSESVTEDGIPVLKRRITFVPGGHPAGAKDAVETCRFYEPSRVDFVAADGSVITNIVSRGPSGKPADLLYTYVFQWRHDGVEANTGEAAAQEEADWEITKTAVVSTIATMRRLVKEDGVE